MPQVQQKNKNRGTATDSLEFLEWLYKYRRSQPSSSIPPFLCLSSALGIPSALAVACHLLGPHIAWKDANSINDYGVDSRSVA